MSSKKLDKLDERIMQLSHLESARQLGRLEGELRYAQMQNFYSGVGEKPEEFKRTEYARLQKHLEREFMRLVNEQL